MKLKFSDPGIIVSGGLHVLALLLLLVSFAAKPQQFDPMQETVPIETVSDTEFNEVMKGEKTAKEVHPEALPQADKVDPAPEINPAPSTPDAQKTAAAPPPPAPPAPEPVKQDTPPPPPPQPTPPEPPEQQTAVLPPERPTDPTPTPPVRPVTPTVPTPPERVDTDAEAVLPKPVPTPPRPPQRTAEAKPMPPVKPKPVVRPPPKVTKPDQLAKLILDAPDQTAEKPQPKTPARPSAAEANPEEHHFDLTDISRLLNGDPPAQKASTGQQVSHVASLGSPTAHSAKMAPSLWGQLDGLMEDQYRQCWSYLGLSQGQKYIPQIRVTYDENGGLDAEPVLVNPPSDPSLRSLAESALRAVRRCNPLRIPSQYAPYYDEWKGRVLRFDPQEMAG